MVIERKATNGLLIKSNNQTLKVIDRPLVIELPGGDRLNITLANQASKPSTPKKRVQLRAKVGQALMLDGQALLKFLSIGKVQLEVPGDDLEFDVQAADPPPPEVDLVIKAGENLKDKLALVKAGTAAQPFRVGLERGGQWTNTLSITKSHVKFMPHGPGAKRPRITADTGVRFSEKIGNIHISGIDFAGSGDRGPGVDLKINNVSDVTVEDCMFQKFSAGVVAHRMPLEMGKPNVLSNLTFRRCRFLDMMDESQKEGHGIFASHVDGLTVEECFIHKAGWNKKDQSGKQKFDIYTHGIYDQAGNKRCVFKRNVLICCESVGVQARGPLLNSAGPDDNSPGPQLINNVMIDCALGMIVNGPRAAVKGNLVVPGHYHSATQQTGQGGMMCHVGTGRVDNNVRLGGGKAPSNGQGQMKAWDISRRSPQAKAEWWWNNALTTDIGNNPDKPQAKVDAAKLDALVKEGREGPASMSQWVTKVRKLLLDTAGIANDFA